MVMMVVMTVKAIRVFIRYQELCSALDMQNFIDSSRQT